MITPKGLGLTILTAREMRCKSCNIKFKKKSNDDGSFDKEIECPSCKSKQVVTLHIYNDI
jgi:predicted Zn-ribbon and HTH transcriptional regulator